MDSTPLYSDLVLIGGGHAHIHLLKMFGMPSSENPNGSSDLLPGIRLTLITKDVLTPYSGMLPGYVAGHYSYEDAHIDLAKLCAFSNFRLIHASAKGIEMDENGKSGRVVIEGDRTDVRFDVLSIDVGSSPMKVGGGGDEWVTPVKPIDEFGRVWEGLVERVGKGDKGGTFEVGIVGGGAGGVELALR
jgi:selenide, water dikinase